MENGETPYFISWMRTYRPWSTFMKEYLTKFDMQIMRLSCSQLCKLLPTPKTRGTIQLVQAAVDRNCFKIALWCLDRQFYYSPQISASFCAPATSPEEEESQKAILLRLFATHYKVSALCAMKNNFKLLKWSQEVSFPFEGPQSIVTAAAGNGNLPMVIWALERGSKWSVFTFREAVKSGNLELMQYLHSKGCPWDETCCYEAAGHTQIEILQWLRSNGCPWSDKTTYVAALRGNLAAFQWAIKTVVIGIRFTV
jgi:hypothetical protein